MLEQKGMFKKLFLLSFLSVLFSGCGVISEATPTVNPKPTSSPLPSPTSTPIPTTTAEPFKSLQGEVKIQVSPPFGKGTISQAAWSKFGTIIAVGGSQGIRLYPADTLQEIRFIPSDHLITSIAFSPDGTTLASGSADLAFSSRASWRRISPWGSENNFVQLWDLQTGRLLETIDAGFSYVTTVAFSPDGALLASGSMYPDDNAVRIWKVASIFDGELDPWQLHKEHTRAVLSIDFNPSSKFLLSGSADNTARLINVFANRPASVLFYRTGAIIEMFAVDYSPVPSDSGEQMVALAGAVFQGSTPTELLEIWNATSGEMVMQLSGHTSGVETVAYSPDGTLLASGGGYPDNSIRIWNAHSGELLRVLEGHASGVRYVSFSPDGKTLISNGWDAMLYLWDAETGQLKRSIDEHTSVVWSASLSPNGSLLATGGDEGFIRLWNLKTGQKLNTFNAHSSRVTSLTFNPGGTILIAGTDEPDFSVQLWDIITGERLKTFEGHTNFVQVMALSPDGKTLASGGALGDNTVRIWDITKSRPSLHVIEEHTRSVKSLAFSANGQVLASGDGTGTIRVIDVTSGEIKQTMEGQTCSITALIFDPGTGYLVSGGCKGVIRMWNLKTGEVVRELTGPDEFVTQLGFHPTTGELVIGFENGSIWFWDAEREDFSAKIENTNISIRAFQFQADKLLAAMDSGGGILKLWTIQP